jgi:hypothetical protein
MLLSTVCFLPHLGKRQVPAGSRFFCLWGLMRWLDNRLQKAEPKILASAPDNGQFRQ